MGGGTFPLFSEMVSGKRKQVFCKGGLPVVVLAETPPILCSAILLNTLAGTIANISTARVTIELCFFGAAGTVPVQATDTKHRLLATDTLVKGGPAAAIRLTYLRRPLKVFRAHFMIVSGRQTIAAVTAGAALVADVVATYAVANAAAGVTTTVFAVNGLGLAAAANREACGRVSVHACHLPA